MTHEYYHKHRIISGIVASLVFKPIRINIEHITSAKTTRARESSEVRLIISGKRISSVEKSICNLGISCVNISVATPSLRINNKTSI